jgi:hypothetical protein
MTIRAMQATAGRGQGEALSVGQRCVDRDWIAKAAQADPHFNASRHLGKKYAIRLNCVDDHFEVPPGVLSIIRSAVVIRKHCGKASSALTSLARNRNQPETCSLFVRCRRFP